MMHARCGHFMGALVTIVFSVLIAGCQVTPRQTSQHVQEGIQSQDRQTKAILDVASADPTLDQSKIAAARADFEGQVEAVNRRFGELMSRIEAQEQALDNLANGLANLVGDFIPGVTWVARTVRAFAALQKEVADEQGDLTRRIDTEIDDLRIKTLATAAELEKRIEELEFERKVQKELATSRGGTIDQRISALDAHIRRMPVSDREQLEKQVLSTLRAEALSDKGFTDQLNAQIRTQAREALENADLTPAQRESLERLAAGDTSLSLEEAVGILGAGGIGVVGLLRTFGKSRSQEEIDELWEKIEGLKTEMARVETATNLTTRKPVRRTTQQPSA